MSGRISNSDTNNAPLPLDRLPTSTLQALYHAVTGKTENLTKHLRGNVEIRLADVEELYHKLSDEIDALHKPSPPTVTITTKAADSEQQIYSSWQRFLSLRTNSRKVTSEIIMKFELLVDLPSSEVPQRVVINVSLDSGLSIISKDDFTSDEGLVEFYPSFASRWRTVEISIDFVDFITGKRFVGVIEDWFSGLKNVVRPRFTNFLLRFNRPIVTAVSQIEKIGAAAFLLTYVYIHEGKNISISELMSVFAISLLLWALVTIFLRTVVRLSNARFARNIIPTVILITEGDTNAYQKVKERLTSSSTTLVHIISSSVAGIMLNIVASYLYTYLTGH